MKTVPNSSFVKDHQTLIELKRSLLIAELRVALNTGTDYHDSVLLWFCGLTEATVAADLAEPVPWEALRLHYHILAQRALEDRVAGKTPSSKTLRERITAAMLLPRASRS